VIGDEPAESGAEKLTLADEFSGVAATPVTGPGTVLAEPNRTEGWIGVTVGVMSEAVAGAALGVWVVVAGATCFIVDC
jgi:hypothetical protein